MHIRFTGDQEWRYMFLWIYITYHTRHLNYFSRPAYIVWLFTLLEHYRWQVLPQWHVSQGAMQKNELPWKKHSFIYSSILTNVLSSFFRLDGRELHRSLPSWILRSRLLLTLQVQEWWHLWQIRPMHLCSRMERTQLCRWMQPRDLWREVQLDLYLSTWWTVWPCDWRV